MKTSFAPVVFTTGPDHHLKRLGVVGHVGRKVVKRSGSSLLTQHLSHAPVFF